MDRNGPRLHPSNSASPSSSPHSHTTATLASVLLDFLSTRDNSQEIVVQSAPLHHRKSRRVAEVDADFRRQPDHAEEPTLILLLCSPLLPQITVNDENPWVV